MPSFKSPAINLYSRDLPAAVAFYSGLGVTESFRTPTTGDPFHVELKLDGFTWADLSRAKLMVTSFYDLSVPTFLQTLKGVAGCLGRAATHCAHTGADSDEFVNARLIADMAPFHFQIEALSNHSVWGLEAVKTGIFAPPALVGTAPFAKLRASVDEAITALEALTPDEVNSWAGKTLDIALYRPHDDEDRVSPWAPRQLAFTSETFLLSFSLPNFYFHVVTAYDILRSRGVPIGKRDYEGRLRTRSA